MQGTLPPGDISCRREISPPGQEVDVSTSRSISDALERSQERSTYLRSGVFEVLKFVVATYQQTRVDKMNIVRKRYSVTP